MWDIKGNCVELLEELDHVYNNVCTLTTKNICNTCFIRNALRGLQEQHHETVFVEITRSVVVEYEDAILPKKTTIAL